MMPVHPLIKAARDKKLPHPGQLEQFEQEHWVEYMNRIGLNNAESVAHISGATWLNNNFQSVENTRKQFSFDESGRPSWQEMVRAHIASANYAFWQVSDEQGKVFADEDTPAIEQLLLSKTTMVGKSDPVMANHVNMHRLDSLRGPLFELFRYNKKMHQLFPDDRPTKLSRMDLFHTEMRMTQFYHSFSCLWQELLYGRTGFAFQPGRVFFIQRQADYHLMKTIGEFRRDHFIMTSMTDARLVMDRLPDKGFWTSYLCYEPGKPLGVTDWQNLPESMQMIARYQPFSALVQLDDHLKILFARQRAAGIERTLQSVLDVWVHLTVLTVQINDRLHTDEELHDFSVLIGLAPLINRSELIQLLCQCCGYSKDEIAGALDLLTWRGKSPQEDLWAQPLVELGDHYVFPVSAFLTSNMSRNIDCWIGKIDPTDDRRGKLFEKDLLRVLENCRAANPVMKKHLRYTSAIKPNYHGHKEEIDLTFSFGNLLVVVEARSRKTPITPLDYDNEIFDSNGLLHKTKQALRKANFVRDHLDRFCQDYYPHLSGRKDIEVISLVIINGQFHAGFPLNGVPVIDPVLLLHFLQDGEARFMADAPYDRHQYGIPLWKNIEEAQARFKDYLFCPTLIKIHKSMCRESEQKSDNLGPGFGEVVTLKYEINFTTKEAYIEHVRSIFPQELIQYF